MSDYKPGWRPIEEAADYDPVLLAVPPFAPMQGTRSGLYKTWMIGARSIFGRDLGPGMQPVAYRPLPPLPGEPDPEADVLRAAIEWRRRPDAQAYSDLREAVDALLAGATP